jgi:endo-1,4-beta-xylanase
VNEAFNDGQALPRQSFWMTHLGRGYVERAFRLADAADPNAALFYNDYNIEAGNAKSDSVYGMLADFKARGVPVDGVGMQFHMIAGALPSLASMQQNFDRFAALGLKIHITELDIRVETPPSAGSLATQAANYRTIYQLCMGTPACEMVVTWGFTDRESWVPGTFPGWGEALLFDGSYAKKPAYDAVHALLAGQ